MEYWDRGRHIFHYSITPLLHYSFSLLLHYCISALLHHSITPGYYFSSIFSPSFTLSSAFFQAGRKPWLRPILRSFPRTRITRTS